MTRLSRRDFVFMSPGTVAGNMMIGGLTEAAAADNHDLDFSQSGIVTGKPKPLKHKPTAATTTLRCCTGSSTTRR